MRTRAGIAMLVAGLVAAALAAPPAHAAAPPSAGTAADRYTPVVMDVMTAPRWYKDRKGALRLVYELRLTNAFPVPVEVTDAVMRGVVTNTPHGRTRTSPVRTSQTLR